MTAPWPRIHPPPHAGPMLGSSPRLLDMGDNSSLLTPPFATIVSALSRLKSVPSYFHPFTSTINIELNIYWDSGDNIKYSRLGVGGFYLCPLMEHLGTANISHFPFPVHTIYTLDICSVLKSCFIIFFCLL